MLLPFLWVSDIHLDHCQQSTISRFFEAIRRTDEPSLVVTGDISVASKLQEHLDRLANETDKKVYFVLGNHDYWGDSVEAVGQLARNLQVGNTRLVYLEAWGPIELAPGVYLTGVDGHADGRAGDILHSNVVLNDYRFCRDFKGYKNAFALRGRLAVLGDRSAEKLKEKLEALFAVNTPTTVYIATHVPPWPEANWYDGKPSDNHWLPHFCNVVLGNLIKDWASRHTTTNFVVLCGHTHGGVDVELAPNLRCLVAAAVYGDPIVQKPDQLPSPDGIMTAPQLHAALGRSNE